MSKTVSQNDASKGSDTANPVNHPRTGRIDTGDQGFTFAGEAFCKWQYAFAPKVGNTRWYPSYAAAKVAFLAAGCTNRTLVSYGAPYEFTFSGGDRVIYVNEFHTVYRGNAVVDSYKYANISFKTRHEAHIFVLKNGGKIV